VDLASAFGVSKGTIHNILRDDLGLVKKSARWVPKILSEDQMKECVRICTELVAAVTRRSKAMLDNIITMDETMVSFHTPETKRQSKKWIQKGKPGPIKSRVHASLTKQMVLAFFGSKGLVYTHIAARGTSINATYIVKVLGKFLKHLRGKRPVMADREWVFYWNNAPVHTAGDVPDWFAANSIQLLSQPPFSPDLAPDLFRRVKEELTGLTLSQETTKKVWEGVIKNIAKEDFAAAFRS
jgi:histone-lysine N-methyltransferase SETMAR